MASVEKRTRDGNTTWLARWRDPAGRQRKKTFKRKLDADRFLINLEHSLVTGSYVDPAAGRTTVSDWAQRWIDGHTHVKPSVHYRYASIVRTHIIPRWGSTALASVSHADVVTWVGRLAAGGQSPSSVRQIHRVLSMILKLAVQDGRLHRNVADGVKTSRPRAADKRFLTHQQVYELANACGRYRLLVLVLAYTGLRFGEVAALRVHSVLPHRRRLEVGPSITEVGGKLVETDTKNHERRYVPLDPELLAELEEYIAGREPGEYLFCAPRGGALWEKNFRRGWFTAAAETAGLAGLTPHELRHTAASLGISAGANAKVVQLMLGHASAAMTLDIYTGLYDDDLDAVAQRMAEQRAKAGVPRLCHDGTVTTDQEPAKTA